MMINRLRELLVRLCPSAPAVAIDIVSTHLFESYRIPRRSYHNIYHVWQCLQELDSYLGPIDKSVIELALWYHDIIYVPHEKQNDEARSGERAMADMLHLGLSADQLIFIVDLIMHTKHTLYSLEEEHEKIMVDADLSILGQPDEIYQKYSDGIREEYFFASPKEYREGRLKILRGFTDRPRIYHTDFFYDKYEGKARDNLEKEIKVLKDFGSPI